MINITLKQAVTALEEAVRARGRGFVYQNFAGHGCAYVHYEVSTEDGERVNLEPGCLVGDALIRLGVAPEAFLEDAGDVTGVLNTGNDAWRALSTLRDRGVITYDDGVADVLGGAQGLQDCGESWGVALDHAKATAYDRLVGES